MRYSKQREAILDIVRETDTHPTADWVFEKTRLVMPSVSLGTVYRNLNQLADNGMIRRLHEGSAVRYDGNMGRHDHLLCTSCGRIQDTEVSLPEFSNSLPEIKHFHVTGYSLDLTGLCDSCKSD